MLKEKQARRLSHLRACVISESHQSSHMTSMPSAGGRSIRPFVSGDRDLLKETAVLSEGPRLEDQRINADRIGSIWKADRFGKQDRAVFHCDLPGGRFSSKSCRAVTVQKTSGQAIRRFAMGSLTFRATASGSSSAPCGRLDGYRSMAGFMA